MEHYCAHYPVSIPDSKLHGANMGPPGSCRPQMGTMLAPWTLQSGYSLQVWFMLSNGLTSLALPSLTTCLVVRKNWARRWVCRHWGLMVTCVCIIRYIFIDNLYSHHNFFLPKFYLSAAAVIASITYEGIRQYDLCNMGELDRHSQHLQPCLASWTPRVVVRQEQPVSSGTHWSSFAHRQMSVVLCLQRFPIKIKNFDILRQRLPQGHKRPPR